MPQFESVNPLMLSLLYGSTLTPIHDYWKYHSFNYIDLYVILHLSTPIECTDIRMNSKANDRFWVIMTCHSRFMDCKKGTTLVLIMGEAMHVWGHGI